MRIEICGTSEHFCRNLIFLDRDSRILKTMLCQISKQFAERLSAVKHMTRGQSFDGRQVLTPLLHRNTCDAHVTKRNKAGN